MAAGETTEDIVAGSQDSNLEIDGVETVGSQDLPPTQEAVKGVSPQQDVISQDVESLGGVESVLSRNAVKGVSPQQDVEPLVGVEHLVSQDGGAQFLKDGEVVQELGGGDIGGAGGISQPSGEDVTVKPLGVGDTAVSQGSEVNLKVSGVSQVSGTSLPCGQGSGKAGDESFELLMVVKDAEELGRNLRLLSQSPDICGTQEIKKEESQVSQERMVSGGDRVDGTSLSGGLPLGQGSRVGVGSGVPSQGSVTPPLYEITSSSSSEKESVGESRKTKKKSKSNVAKKSQKLQDGSK